MSIELKMPALSPTMEEGTLAKWLVKEGDAVKAGDILAEIETDKATMEFEAVDEGTIGAILVPEGTEGVKVGTVTGLALNQETYMADATFTVQDGIVIPSDSTVLISSEGLLGGNFVELQPGGMPDALENGDEVEDTQGAVSMISLMMKFVDGGSSSAVAPADGAAQ